MTYVLILNTLVHLLDVILLTKISTSTKKGNMMASKLRKAMHVLFKRIRNINVPIDLQLYLFDHVILPVAFYGCEI